MTEQYKCKSYYINNVLQDCTCGKCEKQICGHPESSLNKEGCYGCGAPVCCSDCCSESAKLSMASLTWKEKFRQIFYLSGIHAELKDEIILFIEKLLTEQNKEIIVCDRSGTHTCRMGAHHILTNEIREEIRKDEREEIAQNIVKIKKEGTLVQKFNFDSFGNMTPSIKEKELSHDDKVYNQVIDEIITNLKTK